MRGWRIALLAAALATTVVGQRVRLDPSGAFFTAAATPAEDSPTLVTFDAGAVTASMLERFGGGRSSPRILENLAFAMALAAECEGRGLARSAPTLARSEAAQQAVGANGDDPATRARRATARSRRSSASASRGPPRGSTTTRTSSPAACASAS